MNEILAIPCTYPPTHLPGPSLDTMPFGFPIIFIHSRPCASGMGWLGWGTSKIMGYKSQVYITSYQLYRSLHLYRQDMDFWGGLKNLHVPNSLELIIRGKALPCMGFESAPLANVKPLQSHLTHWIFVKHPTQRCHTANKIFLQETMPKAMVDA